MFPPSDQIGSLFLEKRADPRNSDIYCIKFRLNYLKVYVDKGNFPFGIFLWLGCVSDFNFLE